MERTSIFTLFLLLVLAIPRAGATWVDVFLTKDAQGNSQDNVGYSFRPFDESGALAIFVLTARSEVDMTDTLNPDAVSFDTGPGTVVIGKDGAGVRNNAGDGSKEISGGGPLQNEDLIFTFDNPISIDYIHLELVKVGLEKDGMGFKKDSPILLLYDAYTSEVHTVTEGELAKHFIMTGKHEGFVAFSELNPQLLDGLIIGSFKVRETDGHIAVDLITVPEPTTICLLGLGVLALLRRRKK